MMLDLGHDASRLGPTLRLIAEALVAHQGLATRPARRAKQDVFDRQFQALVGRNANGVLHSAFLRKLINLRLGKGRIAPEGDLFARSLLALDLGQQQLLPVLSAVHVAWTQLRRQAIPMLVEQQQRVVADRLEMAVVGAALLLAVDRAFGRIHVEHDALGVVLRLGLRHQARGSQPSAPASSPRSPASPSRSSAVARSVPRRDPSSSSSRSSETSGQPTLGRRH